MILKKTGNYLRNKTVWGLSLFLCILVYSCQSNRSSKTGWEYNNPKNGGFERYPYFEMETGPGLVLIEGGRFVMGRVEQDVNYNWDNVPRTVTVSSYYIDETEVSNIDYVEYLYWVQRVYQSYPEVYNQALPDTLVWRDRLAYNEPYVEYYLRHPAYSDYPVVGVSWLQAKDYCEWRTDRVNELIMIRENLFEHYPNQIDEENFNTEAYFAGQYESGKAIEGIRDLDPNNEYRNIRMQDGIILPKYRLPTEAEWEYAALGLVGNTKDELISQRKIYPWNGNGVRNSNTEYMGSILGNFMRGRGDNMGIAGKLNDNAEITAPVYSYWPNDYGIYNAAGNVSEWVRDVYRPLSYEDVSGFRPFRGNVFQTKLLDEEGGIAEKDSLGRIKYRNVDSKLDNLDERRNYKKADNINYLDGDWESTIYYTEKEEGVAARGEASMYEFGESTLFNDRARVYKGGSWRDRIYWGAPGGRRYLTENRSTNYIGFRCAMDRIGSPAGYNKKRGKLKN